MKDFPHRFLTAFTAAAPAVSGGPGVEKSWMQKIVEYMVAQPRAQVGETYGDTPMASPRGRRRSQYSPAPEAERTLIGTNTLNKVCWAEQTTYLEDNQWDSGKA